MRRFMADFETTTVLNTEGRVNVWAAAVVPITNNTASEEAFVFASLEEFMGFCDSMAPADFYFHNLKFDGMFIVDWLFRQGYKTSLGIREDGSQFWLKTKLMPFKSFKVLISKEGLFYNIEICNEKGIHYTIKDSLKILPFSVKQIGKGFKTIHLKTEIDYDNHNGDENISITKEEEEYIKNDVFVVAEALQTMFAEGYTAATIGSNCMREYKRMNATFKDDFPNLYGKGFGDITDVGAFVRNAYGGAWTYVAPDKQNRLVKNGVTLDVNSLYPYVMHSSSGVRYPAGEPYASDHNLAHPERFYFVRFRCSFHLKHGKLPFVHIRGNPHYPPSKTLESSDINGKQYFEGEKIMIEMTMVKYEFELFLEHYDVDYEILDALYFHLLPLGEFDQYINKYYKQKAESEGAMRSKAKLMQNNLYGKFATSNESSFKIPVYIDGKVEFITVEEYDKEPGYIPVGATVTAAAKCYTIRAAQKNYHPGKPGFCYADTDSLHLDMPLSEVVGVEVDGKKLGAWKCEAEWDKAIFVRAKCYIEVEEGKNHCDIKCAGLPERGKMLLRWSMGYVPKEDAILQKERHEIDKMGSEAWEFANVPRTLKDYKVGLRIPGKLKPTVVPGGVILEKVSYLIKQC